MTTMEENLGILLGLIILCFLFARWEKFRDKHEENFQNKMEEKERGVEEEGDFFYKLFNRRKKK